MKFFPLVNLPARKFNLGDRVQSFVADEYKKYLLEGTVFGYQYQHSMWSEALRSEDSLFIDRPGWVYAVLITYEESDFPRSFDPSLNHFHEDELELIEKIENTELKLDKNTVQVAFGSFPDIAEALHQCSISVLGKCQDSEVLINCGSNEAVAQKIWSLQLVLRGILKASGLSSKVSLMLDGQVHGFLQTSIDLDSIYPNIRIPATMPENAQIIQRASKHQSLLQAISASSVAVTLHDANEASGFTYLDVLVDIPERLNKPREELVGNPASIVDPQIAEPRIHHIKRALAHGQCENYSYTYEDEKNDCLWKFNVSVTPIFGSEEVITIVQDAESWQKGYWVNKLSRMR